MAQSNRNDAKKKGVKRPSAYPTTSDVNTKINCQMQPAQSSKHVVEEIMQRRVFLGRNQVLVRWTGSTKSEWTWEFPESLGKDVDKKIAQFDAKYAASKNDALSQIAEVDLSSPSSNSSDDDDQQQQQHQQQQHVKSVKDTKGTSQYASDASREQGYRQQCMSSIPNKINIKSLACNSFVAPQRNASAIRSNSQRRTDSPTKSSQPLLAQVPSKPSLSSFICSPSIASSSASSVSTPSIPGTPEISSISQPTGKWNANLNSNRSPSGLELGLELEKIIRSHKMGGETFLVVKWKRTSALDLVKLKDVTDLYPNIVLAYFTSLPRRR